jgi:hypothetical protein
MVILLDDGFVGEFWAVESESMAVFESPARPLRGKEGSAERLRMLLLPLSSLGLFCGCSVEVMSRSSAEEEMVVGGIEVSEATTPVERSVSVGGAEFISPVAAGDINLTKMGSVVYIGIGTETRLVSRTDRDVALRRGPFGSA